jgi:hypothetical protein
MHTLINHSDNHSKRESFIAEQDMAPSPSGACQLYSSLNCNRIALKCLKIRGNQFDESLMMMAVTALLQWFDTQLLKPIKIVEKDSVREISVFDCIQYQRHEPSKSFSSTLRVGKSESHLIPCQVSLNQLLPDQWMEAALTQAVAAGYLKEIRMNRAVYRCLQEESSKLVQRDPRFQHLIENLLPCALALDEQLLSIAHQLFPHANASFEDLTLIWRNQRAYQRMINEENPLLRLFHLTRLQRMKRRGGKSGFTASKRKQIRDMTLVAVF